MGTQCYLHNFPIYLKHSKKTRLQKEKFVNMWSPPWWTTVIPLCTWKTEDKKLLKKHQHRHLKNFVQSLQFHSCICWKFISTLPVKHDLSLRSNGSSKLTVCIFYSKFSCTNANSKAVGVYIVSLSRMKLVWCQSDQRLQKENQLS